ncbi:MULTISPECIES: YhdT family protein [Oceanobacillus]|uniref:YhdT family protein n=1 Tax=Oceanobacillus TaxID=182709 RepID=UPI00362C6A02|nr:YhdT family protein [Oceanobacillus sp.]
MKKTNMNQDDYRYKIANREALIGIGIVIINFIWWYGFAYGLGSKNPAEYTYILGLPAWFFYSCVLGFVVMVLLIWLVIKLFFIDIPLDELDDKENKQL